MEMVPWGKLSAVVAPDGAITLPPEAATRLGVKPGDAVEVDLNLDTFEGVRVVRIAVEPREPVDFSQFRGIGINPDHLSTDEYMRLIRDDLDA